MNFDHVKAWRSYIRPEFFKHLAYIKPLYDMVEVSADSIYYINIFQDSSAITKSLIKHFDEFRSRELLAYMAEIVYYYGHLSPYGDAQKNGLYWKFKDIAKASLSKNINDAKYMLDQTCVVNEHLNMFCYKEYSIKDYYHELSI